MRGVSRDRSEEAGGGGMNELSQWWEKQHLLLVHWLAGRQAGDLGQ